MRGKHSHLHNRRSLINLPTYWCTSLHWGKTERRLKTNGYKSRKISQTSHVLLYWKPDEATAGLFSPPDMGWGDENVKQKLRRKKTGKVRKGGRGAPKTTHETHRLTEKWRIKDTQSPTSCLSHSRDCVLLCSRHSGTTAILYMDQTIYMYV